MKITIDTQKDTHEDIKKVLHILTHMLEKRDTFTEKTSSVDTTNMMNMFSNSEPKPATSTTNPSTVDSQDTAPDFSSFLNLTKKEEENKEDKEKAEIQFF